jgi:CRISPR-associated protein Cas1
MHKSVESITMELVLNTFGTSLSRDNKGFVITHKDRRQRLPVVGIKSIQISKGAQITSDAVMLAIENEIEIMFMDKSGKPVGRVWSPKYGSISTIRKGQLNFTFTKDAICFMGNMAFLLCSHLEQVLLLN